MSGFGFVLVVDDDVAFCKEISEVLETNDFKVRCVGALDAAFEVLKSCEPGLILMEQRLGRFDTLARLQELRRLTAAPIILLTSAASEGDRVVALELGADNFLCKPVPMRELLARIRAYSRRAPMLGKEPVERWRIDARQRRVFRPDGMDVPLTTAEFELLNCLAQLAGEPVSKSVLSEKVLLRPYRSYDRSLENLVYQIRRKIREAGGGIAVEAVRGRGFYFRGFHGSEPEPC